MSLRSLDDEGGWDFTERSPERGFADEVGRALQAQTVALEHLLKRHPSLDGRQLAGFLEDVGNRYIDLAESLGEACRARPQRLKSIL